MKKHFLFLAAMIFLFSLSVSAQTDVPVKIVKGGVLNGKAVSLAKPQYPAAARAVNAEGAVSVQVVIDEQGSVISAQAISGHPLLRTAAEQSALQSRFTPTTLSGQTVRVSGIITYNFLNSTAPLNWIKTGYDLASYERFSAADLRSLDMLTAKFPVEWTAEREQLNLLKKASQTAKTADAGNSLTPESGAARNDVAGVTAVALDPNSAAGKALMVRSPRPPADATAEQSAIAQSLISSVQGRLGGDAAAVWQLNLGTALGRAFTASRSQNNPQTLLDNVRREVAAAPSGTPPELLDAAGKLVSILESKDRTPEQRAQIGQLLMVLFKG